MIRGTAPVLLCLGIVGAGLAAPAAADRPKIVPFIDVEQFAEQQLKGIGDSVTYTEVSAGIEAQVNSRRVVSTIAYRFTRRIPESGKTQKNTSHDGLARVSLQVVKDMLALDAGVIATHTRVDPNGAAPQTNTATAANLTQVYGYYAQPSFAHQLGEAEVMASYRFGYVVTQGSSAPALAGLPLVDHFDSSTNQQATFSVGMKRSSLPFDWSIKSDFQSEHASQLAQHFRTWNVSGEVIVPMLPTIAAVGSVGYQSTQTSERSSLLDANGVPVTDSKGRFITDPNSSRTLTYDVKGIVGDGGVIWRPSHRTRLEVRGGYRYDGFSLSGLFEYQPGPRSGMTFVIFDRIDSFGRGVTEGLAQAPAAFDPSQVDGNSSYQNCLFGKQKGTGSCLSNTLGGATASAYRSRGFNFIYSYRMHQTQFNFAGGYARRNYIDLPGAPGSLDGVVDQTFFVQGSIGEQLTQKSGLTFSFSGNLFKNGQVGASDILSGVLNGGYYQSFGRGLRAQATVGVEASKQDGMPTDVTSRAQLGVRYQF
jgi:uncharacterized protein (PEP-CTERM system associated)